MKLVRVKAVDTYIDRKRFGLVDVFLEDTGEAKIQIEGYGVLPYERAREVLERKQREVKDLQVALRFAWADMIHKGTRK